MQRMRSHRSYTDREKSAALAALDANSGNVSATSKQLNMPRQTLIEWKEGRRLSTDVPELRQEKKRELADCFEELARESVETALRLQTHERTTLSMAATAAGIATDKMRLLRGESTDITEQKLANHRWAEEELQKLMRECGWTREHAIEQIKEKAPTWAGMLM